MSEILKPCPFCGSKSKMLEKVIGDSVDSCYDIECTSVNCYLYGGAEWCFDSESQAAYLWNARTKDPYTVDATHTDPVQQETALCLKYRQRARDAEAALKVSDAKNTVMYDALEELSCLGNGEYYGNSEGNRIAQKAISDMVAIADKFMEDVLMPDKGGDK